MSLEYLKKLVRPVRSLQRRVKKQYVTSLISNDIQVTKRELVLVDRSRYSVQMTIWGRQALEFAADAAAEPVIVAKGVKVSDFNGRSLSLYSSSMMQIDPDLDEAHALKGWYRNEGRNESFSSHANMGVRSEVSERKDERKTLGQVKDEGLGMGDTPDYFTTLATIVFIRQENIAYPSCRSANGCKKKLVEDGNGQWRCEKCDTSWDRPQYR